MKMRMMMWGIAAACFALGHSSNAQQKETQPGQDAMMPQWMAAATPGENHKKLDHLVGVWNTQSSMWTEGPEKPPAVSRGTAEMKWILDGRFLQQEAHGEMMGMPFSGFGLTGYDNVGKKYVSVWVDNSSTAIFTSEGTFDGAGKVLTMFGKMDDPVTNEHGKTVKYVTRIVDANTIIFELHDLSVPSGNTKVAEIVYTRKKG